MVKKYTSTNKKIDPNKFKKILWGDYFFNKENGTFSKKYS